MLVKDPPAAIAACACDAGPAEARFRQRLGQRIRLIQLALNPAHDDLADLAHVTHEEEAAPNMLQRVRERGILAEVREGRVVDEDRRWLGLREPHLLQRHPVRHEHGRTHAWCGSRSA